MVYFSLVSTHSGMKIRFLKIALIAFASLGIAAHVPASDPAADFWKSGGAKLSKEDYDGAIADFSRAIGMDSQLATHANKHEFATAYNLRAGVKAGRNDLDGGLVDLDRALELDPKFYYALFNRGVIRQTRHDFDGAIADFNRVIELEPENAETYYWHSLAKRRMGISPEPTPTSDVPCNLTRYTQSRTAPSRG